MTPQQKEFVRLGEFWSKVAEEHDLEKFQTILAEDFVMWYNFEDVDRTREQFLQTLANAYKVFQNQVNANTRISPTADGFVLQATMCGKLNGKEISAPYCLIAKVRDGKVVRGDEYFDPSQLGSRVKEGSTELVSIEG
jgi:ketosteroid isomerase-like protein